MINVNLICIGKLKEQYLRDACAEYIKRLGAFCKITVTEIAPARLSDNPSPAEIENALSVEGKRIEERITNGSYIVAMCIEGKQISSEELAAEIDDISVNKSGKIDFIIGGSYGLADTVKKRADFKLSMSRMTFPHQLARVMLLEQIYRQFMINGGGKYHK